MFKSIRRLDDEHQIKQGGGTLRAVTSWISKGKIIDKARD